MNKSIKKIKINVNIDNRPRTYVKVQRKVAGYDAKGTNKRFMCVKEYGF